MSPGRYRTAREVSCVRYTPVSRLPVEAMRPLSTIFPVLFTPLDKYLRPYFLYFSRPSINIFVSEDVFFCLGDFRSG